MFSYDLRLALQSLGRNPGLTALMVLAVGLGIAVCTVTFTVYHAMATNPIPDRSDRLHSVTLDTWGPERPYDDDHPDQPPMLMTYRDAVYVHDANAAPRSVVMYKSGSLLIPDRSGVKPFNATLRVKALREAGCEVLGMVAIFTYGFKKAADGFEAENCKLDTLSNYNVLVDCAMKSGYIGEADIETLKKWRVDPAVWGV